MGVRPYRTSDSPRHIHWRIVARRQQLMTKEFAEEAQPGLTLALDVFAHPYPAPAGKHTPFEWGVKLAASIGEYAHRRRYPLHLASSSTIVVDTISSSVSTSPSSSTRTSSLTSRSSGARRFVAISSFV